MYNTDQQRQLFQLSKTLLQAPAPLDETTAAAQIGQLVAVANYHEWRYYIQNDPVIADYEYDQLYKKLEALEDAFPNLVRPDSPTQRVSPDLTDAFPSVAHLTPMLSLENTYNEEDLLDFDERVKKLCGLPTDAEVAYSVEPKFDGGTITLLYEGDLLVRAATRGNGALGEEITNNAKAMRSVPLKAAFSAKGISKVELRGEALIKKDVFEKLNKQRQTDGKVLLANPRNAATGALRVKDAREVAQRGLEVFVYQMAFAADEAGNDLLPTLSTHHQTIELLASLGFKTAENSAQKLCNNIKEVVAYCQKWQEKRDTYAYEIDGMVVKVDDFALQEKCGSTSHHPRWAAAFKFRAKQASTKLLQVDYQVGKIGSITPVAKVEPVHLAGVTVSSVSLHNEDFIQSKDLRIGDTVLVERAGDVIPYIVKAMDELRDGSEQPIVFPEFCPINQTEQVPLVREAGEAAWRCPECSCGAQDVQRLIFHVSKDGMDVEGFGKSIVERFYQLGWLQTIPDCYKLDYDKIANLEGFGQKSAENLRNAINKAKTNPLHKLLQSLSIHHLGKRAAQLLAAEVPHALELASWDEERFLSIKEIGPVLAKNVMRFFAMEKNVAMLHELEHLGVNLAQTEADRKAESASDGPLAGKSILFTGTLQTMGRKEAEKLAAAAGAKLLGAVSSNLDILVAGEKAGSKLKKAQAIPSIKVMSEEAFLEMVGG
jgi:DNA ligase (NAD+)